MFRLTRKYSCPNWYDLYIACHTHGWVNLAPFSWDEEQRSLEFSLLIDSQAVDVLIHQVKRVISALICAEKKFDSISLKRLDAVLARILGLKEDTAELFDIARRIGRLYPELMKKGAGRLLRGATLWEDAAKTLFTTNCSWALTQKMCEKICSSEFTIPSPSGRYPFPHSTSLAEESPDSLKRKMPIGYRAEYLKLLSTAFTQNSMLTMLEVNSLPYDSAYKIVGELKGFGRYASSHLLILAGYYERIPVDSEVLNYIKKNISAREAERYVDRRYARWGRYRWWGFKFEKMLKRQNWLGD